jgi:signal transduction histidine kinase
MTSTTTTLSYRLTSWQKWQLALSVFVVYFPIRIYVNVGTFSWALIVHSIPFWLLETLLSVLFFYAWITVAEWLQKLFFNRFGEGFLIEFKIPAQLATLAIASALAVVFNIGFFFIWRSLDATLENRFGVYREQEARLARPALAASLEERRKRGDQRRRTNNGLTVMAMLSAFYLAANRRAYRRLEDVQLRAERLEKENVQAQFAALKSQVIRIFSSTA